MQTRFTVTAAAVILDEENRVLLLKHVFRAGSGWGVPGGFISADEQPEQAMRRELREEIGLEVEKAELAFVRTLKRVNQIEIVFRCRAAGVLRAPSIEIAEIAWLPVDSLPAELGESQLRLIERALTGYDPDERNRTDAR